MELKNVKVGPKSGTIGPKFDKSGTFSYQFQYILARRAKMHWNWSLKFPDWSHLGPIWPTLDGAKPTIPDITPESTRSKIQHFKRLSLPPGAVSKCQEGQLTWANSNASPVTLIQSVSLVPVSHTVSSYLHNIPFILWMKWLKCPRVLRLRCYSRSVR